MAKRRKKPAADSADARRAEYLALRAEGVQRAEACRRMGISYSAVGMWRQRCPEFRQQEEEARIAGVERWKQVVIDIMDREAMENPQHALAAARLLLSTDGALVTRHEVSGPGGGPVESRVERSVDEEAIEAALSRWSERLAGDPDADG